MEQKLIPFPIKPNKIVILLSFNLDGKIFPELFEEIGFSALWAKSYGETENFLRHNKPDVAIQWQAHPNDHSILELVKKYWKETPVLLCLNYNGKLPPDFKELGYAGYLTIPMSMQELFEKMYAILTQRKRELPMELWQKLE